MAITFITLVAYLVSLTTDMMLPGSHFWLTAGLVIAAILAAFGWAMHLDEGALNAHYVAWYWGGSLGLALSALTYVAAAPASLAPGWVENTLTAALGLDIPNIGFHAGFLLGCLPAVVGYLIWWTVVCVRRGA
ncbi:MAG: hypothetical protein JNJ63_02845 [Hyphomonadaceae bacterium]|nr:hypothetical protein [Hyphomonadaceae bacterium]